MVEPLRQIVVRPLGPLGAELGWQALGGESDTQGRLRANVLGILISARDPGTVATAQQLFAKRVRHLGRGRAGGGQLRQAGEGRLGAEASGRIGVPC